MSSPSLRVACLQMSAGANIEVNLATARKLIIQAKRKGAVLACLPEVFYFRSDNRSLHRAAVTLNSPFIKQFQTLAARLKMALLLGSVIEKTRNSRKFFNTSVFVSERGEILGVYRKIHLFEINLPGKVKVTEKKHMLPGKKTVIVKWRGIHWGLSICYDLRFPELFRDLTRKGAQVILVPANFTYETGKAHWETLLRARAIENQVYVLAPGQSGRNPDTGLRSYGHSLILDPWGNPLAEGSLHRQEVLIASLNWTYQDRLRRQLPVLKGL